MEKTIDAVIQLHSLNVARFVVNGLRENTYIVYNDSGEGFIIDCGARSTAERRIISTFINTHNIRLSIHVLTHCHFDHLWGTQWLFDEYGLMPTVPEKELLNYENAQDVASIVRHRRVELPLPPNPLIMPDEIEGWQVIPTPGHTLGSVCFYNSAEEAVFTGDSLFKGFIGLPKEPEIPAGMMQQTLEEKIYPLPTGTLILPGHGPDFRL